MSTDDESPRWYIFIDIVVDRFKSNQNTMFPFYTFIHMTGMGPPKTGVSLYCVMRMNFTNLSKGEKFKIIYAVICFFYFFFHLFLV